MGADKASAHRVIRQNLGNVELGSGQPETRFWAGFLTKEKRPARGSFSCYTASAYRTKS